MPPLRFMAIDCGSNATKWRAWEIAPGAPPRKLAENRHELRLGRAAFNDGFLDEALLNEAETVFAHIRQTANDLQINEIRAVATSALREVKNPQDILTRLAFQQNIHLEIISPEQEAQLNALAVRPFLPPGRLGYLVFDIGGGSTEVVHDDGEKLFLRSLPLGAVRLKERFFAQMPPAADQIAAARELIQAQLNPALAPLAGRCANIPAFGIGGTSTAISWLGAGAGGQTISLATIRQLHDQLATLTVDQIQQQFNLDPPRAEIIFPGALILQELLNHTAAPAIKNVPAGITDGLLQQRLAEQSMNASNQ